MSYSLLLWMIAIPINLLTILNLCVKIYKNEGSINWIGAAWLSIFSVLLGPMFTVLTCTILFLERCE